MAVYTVELFRPGWSLLAAYCSGGLWWTVDYSVALSSGLLGERPGQNEPRPRQNPARAFSMKTTVCIRAKTTTALGKIKLPNTVWPNEMRIWLVVSVPNAISNRLITAWMVEVSEANSPSLFFWSSLPTSTDRCFLWPLPRLSLRRHVQTAHPCACTRTDYFTAEMNATSCSRVCFVGNMWKQVCAHLSIPNIPGHWHLSARGEYEARTAPVI